MTSEDTVNWEPVHVLAQRMDIKERISKNIATLLDAENTIPFIARYRKEQTEDMSADKLREFKNLYDDLKHVITKIDSVSNAIEKIGKMNSSLKSALKCCQSYSEVEHLYAPFKTGSKRSLAQRAKDLGLEPLAMCMLKHPLDARINDFVKPSKDGLKTEGEVEIGVQHIIAEVISKDKDTMDKVRELCKTAHVTLESSQAVAASKKKESSEKSVKDSQKYEQYYNFKVPVKYAKPHQVLAINRGETKKLLTVKINIPEQVKERFVRFCQQKFTHRNCSDLVRSIIQKSIEDAYKRLIHPLICRQFRSDLKKVAEKASIDVFAGNLKQLLLTPPIRGKVVLGVDPGFTNGCKLAVTDPMGAILETGVVYIHSHKANKARETMKLRDIILKHRCETVAIGNGTACRETEALISDCIKNNTFKPLNVMYCIVNENGASIYSVSEEAQLEMPDLDPTLRGAVSIARRLQDPLIELVKTEPKHIGVGMYQHDVSETQLKQSLDEVVEECVSFVGVDLNVCTDLMLRRIAGLNKKIAKNIVDWRTANGMIKNRKQLLKIRGLGPKTFEQCAGFIRILPSTVMKKEEDTDSIDGACMSTCTSKKRKSTGLTPKSKKRKLDVASFDVNPLDSTWIHPESYTIATRFLEKIKANPEEIGHSTIELKVEAALRSTDVCRLAKELGTDSHCLQLIIDGVQQSVGSDIREEFEKPLFKKGLVSMDSISPGTKLTGKVVNVTHFGAFVDVGLGRDGLIHSSAMGRVLKLKHKDKLQLGDKVEVKVTNLDKEKGRIGLALLDLL
ncbi:unnamed protein product [Owenia fusiformis]|uniref:S1 motif domain-containing protein n=1 Tax=Owenia fusiformis TaxID=6347 RepID=A0A8S4PHE0_OWEFU|nr:unnamed protein product [Owenia fusiformis]